MMSGQVDTADTTNDVPGEGAALLFVAEDGNVRPRLGWMNVFHIVEHIGSRSGANLSKTLVQW